MLEGDNFQSLHASLHAGGDKKSDLFTPGSFYWMRDKSARGKYALQRLQRSHRRHVPRKVKIKLSDSLSS
ncbi:hypothetical protein Bca101_015971 [Brassica carinata]